ncbi:MAG: DUF1330 domain-containing protein [Pseudomonadota bacterium]
MSAFVIVDGVITDAEAYERYKAHARPLAEKHGGVYRARGGRVTVEEPGAWTPQRLVVIEFPARENAEALLNDPEYAPWRKIRQRASEATLIILDGV